MHDGGHAIATMKAAGCQDHVATALAAHVTAAQAEALAAVPNIDWGKLWEGVQKYGPGILTFLLGLLGKAA